MDALMRALSPDAPQPPPAGASASPDPASVPRMKKSCERCSASKVKCDGALPCEKCAKRGCACIYAPEGKRGRRPKGGVAPPPPGKHRRRQPPLGGGESDGTPSDEGDEDEGSELVPRKTRTPAAAAATAAPSRLPHASAAAIAGDRAAAAAAAAAMAGTASHKFDSSNECWNNCSIEVRPSIRLAPSDQFQGLDHRIKDYERRLLRVFFALYKHHLQASSECCRMWFSHQINKIWTLWNSKGIYGKHEHSRFMKWIVDHNFNVDASVSPLSTIPTNPVEEETGRLLPPTLGAKAPRFPGIASLQEGMPTLVVPLQQQQLLQLLPTPSHANGDATLNPALQVPSAGAGVIMSAPTPPNFVGGSVNFRTAGAREPYRILNLPYMSILTAHEGSMCDCNEAFVKLTGFNAHEAMGLMYWTRDGFLPWGGDLVAMVADSDEATLNYLRLCSQYFALVGRPVAFPATRTVQLAVEGTIVHKDGHCIPNQVMSITVNEYLSLGRTQVDVLMVLTPRQQQQQQQQPAAMSRLPSSASTWSLGGGAALDGRRDSLWSAFGASTVEGAAGSDAVAAATPSAFLDRGQDLWNLDEIPWSQDMPGLAPLPSLSTSSDGGSAAALPSARTGGSASSPEPAFASSTPTSPTPEDDETWLNTLLKWVDE